MGSGTDWISLEERVSHAELARDNALQMADEVQQRSKELRKSVGSKIGALRDLILEMAEKADPHTKADALYRLNRILEKPDR